MVRTDKIRGLMAEKGVTRKEISEKLGITPETFRRKMHSGIFLSDEIEILIKTLEIEDPMSIFFADRVAE